jgi:hypothetical protein
VVQLADFAWPDAVRHSAASRERSRTTLCCLVESVFDGREVAEIDSLVDGIIEEQEIPKMDRRNPSALESNRSGCQMRQSMVGARRSIITVPSGNRQRRVPDRS